MRILLDTHTFLWFSADNSKLSSTAKNLILAADNEKLLSVVVGWEIAIKHSLGKLPLNASLFTLLDGALERPDWSQQEINASHIAEVAGLTFHHRDPFDRMLVAQSLVAEVPLVSNDDTLDAYCVERLW